MLVNQLRVGTTVPIALRLGTIPVERAYVGNVLVYGEEPEEPSYTVFGAAAPSYTMDVYTDGDPSIELGNVFYFTEATGSKIGWRCVGGRVYIPNDARVTNRPIRLRAYIGIDDRLVGNVGEGYEQEKTTVTPASGGWCEVLWDTPITLEYGPDTFWMVITYSFTDPADTAKYLVGSGAPSTATMSGDVGAALCLAEASSSSAWQQRGQYAIDGVGNYAFDKSASWYGTDIIIAEPPAPSALLPVAAYNFNEGSGTAIADSSGNGHTLATQTQYFTANGHSGSGLQQLSANDSAIVTSNGSFTALDTRVQREFTIMFWGKYTANGTAGTNWTVRQTSYGGSATAWGVQMSDGANTVFFLHLQGYEVPLAVPKQPAGEWHHYAMTGNGFANRFYVDGVLVADYVNYGTAGLGNDANLWIFDVSSMQSQVVDDLRFYAAALNPAAIAYHMSQ